MKAHKVALALTLSGAFLSACASAEPQRDLAVDATRPVTIGIVEDSVEQTLLGELYARVISGEGKEVNVTSINATRQEDLNTREVDFIIGCTGELLEDYDPAAARELASQPSDSPGAGVVGVEEYETLLQSLPTDLRSTDMSTAQGCESQESDLEQNVVPIFRTGMFDREQLQEIRGATVLLTTEGLEQMLEDVEDGATAREAVGTWFGSVVFTEQEQ